MHSLSLIRVVCLSAALMFCTHAFAEPAAKDAGGGFTVKVKMANLGKYQTLISYSKGDDYVMNTDSTVEDGYQVFRGSVEGIVKASFTVRRPENNIKVGASGFIPGPSLSFLLRNGTQLVIEGDATRPYMASVKSDDPQAQAYEVFRSRDKVFEDEKWSMLKKQYATDPPAKADEAAFKALDEKRKTWMKEFVRTHADTYAAIDVFSQYAMDLTDEERATQFAAMPDTFKNSALGMTLAGRIRGTAATSAGKSVLTFSQPGSDGKTVDIAALKGKVVLIDFWGSWCGPCRESHPHLKELYSKYKGKGFEIVGIAQEQGSREQQEKAWRKAIREDGIPWREVLNDKSGNDLVKLYGIGAFPTKILVDRKGVIRARFLDEAPGVLDRKLEELLGESS